MLVLLVLLLMNIPEQPGIRSIDAAYATSRRLLLIIPYCWQLLLRVHVRPRQIPSRRASYSLLATQPGTNTIIIYNQGTTSPIPWKSIPTHHSMHASTFLVFLLPFVADAFTSRRSALTDCLYAGNVPILLTSSPDWSLVTQPYNLRLTRSPAVVAMPRTVADVGAPSHPPPGAKLTTESRSNPR